MAYSDGEGGLLRGGSTKQTALVLPEGYLARARAAAERRLALAGHRIADTLEATFD